MFSGYIKADESIVKKAVPSKASIIVSWLSVPSFFLIYYIMTLPARIKTVIVSTINDSIQEQLGIEKLDFSFELIPFEMPMLPKLLISIPIVMLVLAWLGFQAVMTCRLLSNHLWLTNERIFGRSNGMTLIANTNEIKNVMIESSIWGRLFGYGDLNIVTKSGSITVRSVAEPNEWKRILMKFTE